MVENSDQDVQVTFYLTDAHEMNWVTEFLDSPFFSRNETESLFRLMNSHNDVRGQNVGRFRLISIIGTRATLRFSYSASRLLVDGVKWSVWHGLKSEAPDSVGHRVRHNTDMDGPSGRNCSRDSLHSGARSLSQAQRSATSA
jgi:hypothetical protein